MSADSEALEKLKIFLGMQQTEVVNHWNRNNYFLLVSSILLLTVSQFKGQTLQIVIGVIGLSLNSAWLSIQYSSNRYLKHWHQVMYELGSKVGLPDFYPKTGRRIPIRIITFFLPVPFLILWLAVIVLATLGNLTVPQSLP